MTSSHGEPAYEGRMSGRISADIREPRSESFLITRKLGWDIQPAWVGPHCDQPGSPVAATPAGRLKAEGQAGPGTSTDPRDLLGQPGCRPAAREPGLNCGDHNSIAGLMSGWLLGWGLAHRPAGRLPAWSAAWLVG